MAKKKKVKAEPEAVVTQADVQHALEVLKEEVARTPFYRICPAICYLLRCPLAGQCEKRRAG